jgi:hypothetical protein
MNMATYYLQKGSKGSRGCAVFFAESRMRSGGPKKLRWKEGADPNLEWITSRGWVPLISLQQKGYPVSR